MDIIREHLIYKDVPVLICMSKLTHIEQYECIRLLLATRVKDVSVCTHECVNPHVETLLKKMNVKFTQCWDESLRTLKFE